MIKTSRRIWIIAALSLIGFGLEIVQTQHFYALREGSASFKSYCNVGAKFNCDVVSASSYAEFVGGLPISSFAAGWLLAILCVALLASSAGWRKEASRALMAMTGFSTLMTLIWLYFMFAKVGTYCIECLGLDAINVLSFALALSIQPPAEDAKRGTTDTGKFRTFALITAGCLFASVLLLKSFQSSPSHAAEENEIVDAVLSSPVLPVASGSEFPSLGEPQAPVTIVEFSDFQCPYCRVAALTLKTLEARYPGKVRVVLRTYPLDPSCNPKGGMHTISCEAARAAICANKQGSGKFRAVYEEFFENQESLPAKHPLDVAKGVSGIDPGQLEGCVASPEAAMAVSRDLQEGDQLGVQGTPTIFVNGKRVPGFPNLSAWSKLVERLAP